MIKINFVCIGTLKETYLKDMFNEYKKRLSKYAEVNVIEHKEVPFSKINDSITSKILAEEGEKLLSSVKSSDYVILLDLHGKDFSTLQLKDKLEDVFSTLRGDICIIIGGPLGLSDAVRNRADLSIKLSSLTYTHQMCRILMIEQIYRVFKIINNESYHY